MRGLRGVGVLGGMVAMLGGGFALAQGKPPALGAPQPQQEPGGKFGPAPAPVPPPAAPQVDKFANPPPMVTPRAETPPPAPPAPRADKFGNGGAPAAPSPAPTPPAAAPAPVPPNEPAALGQLRAMLGPGTSLSYRSAAEAGPGAARMREAEIRTREGERITAQEMVVERPGADAIGALTAQTLTFTTKEGQVTAIGRMELRDFSVQRPAPGATMRPDQMSLGLLRLEALAVQGERPVGIAEILVQDYRAGRAGRATVTGLDMLVPEGGGVADRVKVARMALEGIDLAGTLAALADKQTPPRPPGAYTAAIEGVTVTQGDAAIGSLGAMRMTGALGQGGPDTGRVTLEGLRVEPFPMIAPWLQRLGYQALTGDFSVESRVDQAAGRLELVGMLLGVRDAGAFGLSLTMDGIAPEGSTQEKFAAARLVSLTMRYLDQSLLQRLAAAEARERRQPERQIREAWANQATGAMQGGTGAVAPVLAAVQRLLRGQAQEVTINMQPPKPVPVSELSGAAAGGPAEVQRMLGITATSR